MRRMRYRRRSMRRRFVRKVRRTFRKTRSANIVQAKRTILYDSWLPNTASTNGFWRYLIFTLNDIPSVSDFVNMFDLYKIKAIRINFVPKYDSFGGNDTTDTTAPGLTNNWGIQPHVIVDPNSTVSPSGVYGVLNYAGFAENGNVTQHAGNKPFSVYFRPRVMDTVGGVSATPRISPWIQTSQITLNHRGVHVYMTDFNFSGTAFSNQGYNMFVTYYLQFKNLK